MERLIAINDSNDADSRESGHRYDPAIELGTRADPHKTARSHKDDAIKLILSIIACQGAGSLGSIFTSMSVSTWYPTLVKPWFTPPAGVIPVVWILLFTLMGVSLFLVWREGVNRHEVKLAIYAFSAQFAVNILWSAAFFGMRSPLAGLVVIIVLWIMILLTMVKIWPVSRNAALLLVPYIIWVSFAAYLNYSLLMLNP